MVQKCFLVCRHFKNIFRLRNSDFAGKASYVCRNSSFYTGGGSMVKRELLSDEDIEKARQSINPKHDGKYFEHTFPLIDKDGNVKHCTVKQARKQIYTDN